MTISEVLGKYHVIFEKKNTACWASPPRKNFGIGLKVEVLKINSKGAIRLGLFRDDSKDLPREPSPNFKATNLGDTSIFH